VPIPYLRAQKGYRSAEIQGLDLRTNLIDHPNWRLGPLAKFRQGYSDVENNKVDDLTNRGGSFELGFTGGYVVPVEAAAGAAVLELGSDFLFDASSGHDGYVITPFVTYNHPITERLRLIGGFNFSYASGDYMSHYFSIDQSDSRRSGLDEYDADADVKNIRFSLRAPYQITNHWSVVPVAAYGLMTGDAADSPVVDDVGNENQFFGAVVGVYTW
jgi:outer membrane protein